MRWSCRHPNRTTTLKNGKTNEKINNILINENSPAFPQHLGLLENYISSFSNAILNGQPTMLPQVILRSYYSGLLGPLRYKDVVDRWSLSG